MKSIVLTIVLGSTIPIDGLYAQRPQVVSAVIDGCGLSDGYGEYVVVYGGGSSFTLSPSTLDLRYGTSSPASTTFTDSFESLSVAATWASTLNALLPLSGCSDLNFIGASSGSTIPSGSHLVVFNNINLTSINFSGWCGLGLGNVYVVLSNDSSWPDNGLFANSPSGFRYFQSIVNGTTTNFNYQNLWASTRNGNYLVWHNGGGAPFVYANYPNCNPTDGQSLPVDLISFKVIARTTDVMITWSTAWEVNNSHFEVQRSPNGWDWNVVGEVEGSAHATHTIAYSFVDAEPLDYRSYYRLKQVDFSGQSEIFEVQSVYFKREFKVKIVSNPVSEILTLTGNRPLEYLQATNNSGQFFDLRPIDSNTYNVSHLGAGYYRLIIPKHPPISFIVDR
ncbi:hypothetical protein [Roseivirga sp. UBA838]|uniref:hypothetical protein n=1 Tax=Roseivirga sp. UBA838 TaxID=1947393 RepID=UPI002580A57A|nr:hypothetical protein [Roseivirga sp. UBA838]|tara:strand:+ start:195 stop:1370 length:1176 start_codon:yes stop_codon:yes gene_type:complete